MEPPSIVEHVAIALSSPDLSGMCTTARTFSLSWYLAKYQRFSSSMLRQRLLSLPCHIQYSISRSPPLPPGLLLLPTICTLCRSGCFTDPFAPLLKPEAFVLAMGSHISQWVLQVTARASSGIGSYSGI